MSEYRLRRWGAVLSALLLLALAGCVAAPPPRPVVVRPAPVPPPDPTVYFYPTQGQTPEQQDRDRYECHNWAVGQTGFDPSQPNVVPRQRVVVVPGGPPPGAGVATGAVTGAVLGAAVSDPWRAGQGALVGALAGAVVGGIVDAGRAQQAQQVQTQLNAGADARYSAYDQRASNYKRAMSACLEGRGYNVR